MISVAGELDITTAGVFAAAVADTVCADAGGRIVLELDRVTLLAAHGLAVILAVHDHLRHHGGVVVLVVGPDGPAASALRFLPVGLGPVTYRTLTAALAVTHDLARGPA